MRHTAIALTLGLMLLAPTVARADIHQGDFEIQGWCITGPDPRMGHEPDFDYAVTGMVNGDANLNDPPHVHLDDIITGGFLPNVEASYGHAYIFSGYWVEHMGQKHFRAYVTKDDKGLEEVPCPVALQVTQNTKDQYLPEGTDVEMQRQHGLGSDGQTTTEQGRPRGKE